jgi:hypothetical protein
MEGIEALSRSQDRQMGIASSRKDASWKCGPQGQANQPEWPKPKGSGESNERPLEPPGARKGFPETDPTA